MRLGDLDRLIIIEQPTETKDAAGHMSKTWATYSSPWAKLEAKTGGEDYESNELVGQRSVNWVVRYDAGITQKMRVNNGGLFYEIMDFQYLDRNCFMRLITEVRDSKML